MNSLNNILIVLPAYNEGSVIATVIDEVRTSGFNNIIVVNDGSDDNTSEILDHLQVKELKLPLNRGVGAAMRTALLYAIQNQVEHLVFMDADGQHYPSDIASMYAKMTTTNADMVIGCRFHENQSYIPFLRKIYNKIANLITNLGNASVSDSQSGFRLLNQNAINKIELEIDDYGVCTEMIWRCKRLHLKIEETPIKVRYTDYSMSKGQNFFKGIQTGMSIIKKI